MRPLARVLTATAVCLFAGPHVARSQTPTVLDFGAVAGPLGGPCTTGPFTFAPGARVPAGYGGLSWAETLRTTGVSERLPSCALTNVSSRFTIAAAGAPFAFQSVRIAAPPGERPRTVFLEGWLGGTRVFDTRLTGITDLWTTLLSPSAAPVDLLTFTAVIGDDSPLSQVVLDDFTFVPGAASVVPEPATLALVGAGLAAVAGRRRRGGRGA